MFLDEVSKHPSNIGFHTSAERRIKIHNVSSSVLPDMLVRRRILHFYIVATFGQGVFVVRFGSVEFFFVARNIGYTFIDHDWKLFDDVRWMIRRFADVLGIIIRLSVREEFVAFQIVGDVKKIRRVEVGVNSDSEIFLFKNFDEFFLLLFDSRTSHMRQNTKAVRI